jgi:hypothetical protein
MRQTFGGIFLRVFLNKVQSKFRGNVLCNQIMIVVVEYQAARMKFVFLWHKCNYGYDVSVLEVR